MHREEGNYADDAPYVDEETTPEELLDYAKSRVEEPIEVNDCQVYHFSSHVPDMEALEEATENLNGVYIVPFQVDSAWSFIWATLPAKMKRESDFLIYIAHEGRYAMYPNFYKHERTDTSEEFPSRVEMQKLYNDRR